MNIEVSIENATDQTPSLAAVNAQNAEWVGWEKPTVGHGIAARKTLAGELDALFPFIGNIRLRYAYVPAPGPGTAGADIDFTFNGQLVDGKPLIGCGAQRNPDTAYPGTSWDVLPVQPRRQGVDYRLVLTIKP